MPQDENPKPNIFTPVQGEDLARRIQAQSRIKSSEYYVPTKWERFVEKWIWYDRGVHSFPDVHRMQTEFSREGYLQGIWYSIKYSIKHLWELPGDIRRDVKAARQRIKRGWADRDVWNFNYYLSDVIAGGIAHLKATKNGVPTACFNNPTQDHSEEDMKIAEAKWNAILDEIIWTFTAAKKIQDHDWFYPEWSEYFTPEEVSKWERFCEDTYRDSPSEDCKVMSREEVNRYRNGWKLFQQHYSSLWD